MLLIEQERKKKISPFQHAPIERRPFGKDNRNPWFIPGLQVEGIAPNDVALKDEPDGLAAVIVCPVLKQAQINQIKYSKEPVATLLHVIFLNINSVNG